MTENMPVWVEVWPVAADEVGIWLLSGDDAWRSGSPVPSDSEPHFEVDVTLRKHGVSSNATTVLHSTSWRADGPAVILTYMAVIDAGDLAREQWSSAKPVSALIPSVVGRPPTNPANEPPAPRYIDVLLHGLRHLRFLRDHDATASEAMGPRWRQHLEPFGEALAGMYGVPHHQ
jgi:hypothetical protein